VSGLGSTSLSQVDISAMTFSGVHLGVLSATPYVTVDNSVFHDLAGRAMELTLLGTSSAVVAVTGSTFRDVLGESLLVSAAGGTGSQVSFAVNTVLKSGAGDTGGALSLSTTNTSSLYARVTGNSFTGVVNPTGVANAAIFVGAFGSAHAQAKIES